MSTTASGSERHPTWSGWLAWGLWAGYMLLIVFAIWFAALSRGYGDMPSLMPVFERILIFIPGNIAFTTVGALVAARQPHNSFGWLFLANGIMSAVGGFAEGYWRYALLVRQGELPGGS